LSGNEHGMTRIDFHFNAEDKLVYACRLVRKAWRTGAQVAVTGDPQLLEALDRALWTQSEQEFLPHCMGDAQAWVLQASPVVLTDQLERSPHHQVAVNLGEVVPSGFERFDRLIEVISTDSGDRTLGRQRWKHYADRGYAIERKDLAPAASASSVQT
jgi:DNA polymerase-3 subunit chi